MTREELIKKVALKMDEISSSDDVIVNVTASDNNPLYTQIDGLLNESINDVLLKAPIYRLQSNITTETKQVTVATGSTRNPAVLTVPSGFLRFVSISSTLLDRPITDLAVEGDNVDKMQHNVFLMAKSAKPVGVISKDGKSISCYSFASGAKPSITLNYIKSYTGSGMTSNISLDDYVINIVSWVCAGKVFGAQGDINKNKICNDNAIALMV